MNAWPSRWFCLLLLVSFLARPAVTHSEERYAGGGCLSSTDARHALQSAGGISLAAAVSAARSAAPGEIVDYKVCQAPSGYSYVLTVLGTDGKVVRAWVDALSGKLVSVK
jgi:uncharacterized membrane protein YkoI